MKKITISLLSIITLLSLSGCGANSSTTVWGGTKEITLPEGMKFVNYNIQDPEIVWFTYRPMRKNENPETYIIQQNRTDYKSNNGNGKFIIYEVKNGVKSKDIK